MSFDTVLIANRGEIAVRIARALADLGLKSVAVHSEDDAQAPHVLAADAAAALPGAGPRAYLDGHALVAAARTAGAQAIHPGYGFLSERADFAELCAASGLVFIGPSPETLRRFGDKAAARALAEAEGVPVAEGSGGACSLEEARAFLRRLGGGRMMIKAAAGGGGRGMRVVSAEADLDEAFERCRSEATAAFGDGALYVERALGAARHIEIQIAGDGAGGVSVLGDRDCSLQRRRQKMVEFAPSPYLDPATRAELEAAAARLAGAVRYHGLGTFEFLVSGEAPGGWVFIEANARLQVEHTVTEAVLGVDLVQAQVRLARGEGLEAAGVADAITPVGFAVQLRLNAEIMAADGSVRPAGGRVTVFEPPAGPGVRVDAAAYAGYATNPNFDSLLAKIIVHDRRPDFRAALRKAERALEELRLEGVGSNLPVLRALVRRTEVAEGAYDTLFVETRLADLLADPLPARTRHFSGAPAEAAGPRARAETPDGAEAALAPTQGLLIALSAAPGEIVRKGQTLAVLESMKMEHLVESPVDGRVASAAAEVGAVIDEGDPVVFVIPEMVEGEAAASAEVRDLDAPRPDLAEALARIRLGLDEARPDAVARRRKLGMRTARENVAAICDDGSFIEYGALAIAAQRRRRTVEDLMANTPADGLITGVGSVNGGQFPEDRARCAVLVYDYTVLAGTQGTLNHKKTDRLLEIVEREALPVIWFAEGGGGRPGDTDGIGATGLDVPSFEAFARLSGLAPRIGVASGRCFAGNAVFFGCCDVTIATRDSTIGMAGPAMIEGGGLGVFRPDEVGPIAVQSANGVVDLIADDEAHAAELARQTMSYFQGAVSDWTCADQRRLRHAIPENRLRVYDVRELIRLMVDDGSFLELRGGWGRGMITALVRVEGRPLGLIANDPKFLGGAIDSDGASKAARFMQLCDAFGLPILSLCDTPGFMVGPESEKTAPVRHGSRMFIVAAALGVPIFSIVLRKGYGLGAQAMTGGSFPASFFTISWPTGEFGGMGLEGAVRLGYRKELEAETDPAAHQALYESLVARMYERGKAVNVAQTVEIDAVIDPAHSRDWILRGLKSMRPRGRDGHRRYIDAW